MHKNLEQIFYDCKKPGMKWSTYFPVYEKHLNKFVNKKPRILEIGIMNGGSVEMWLNYFGKGTEIIAIDINPTCLNFTYDGDVKTIIGDQGSELFWDDFLKENKNFDIVLDDGGHTMVQQIVTLNKVFPILNDNGVFLVEDIHTSYWEHPWGGFFRNPETFLEYSKKIIDVLNIEHFNPELMEKNIKHIFENLYCVSYYNSIVVLEKQQKQKFTLCENK